MKQSVGRINGKWNRVWVSWCAVMMLYGCGGGDGGGNEGQGASPAASASPSPTSTSRTAASAPTVSGKPADEAVVDKKFTFRPVASDADGDSLTFAIQNKPEWAEFDKKSGRLSGTPTAADVGDYIDIRISVTDGKTTTALPAFEITVAEIADGAVTLAWMPPTSNTDGSVLKDLAGYEIHYGTDFEELTEVVKISNPSVSSYIVDNLPSATWYFAVKAYAANGALSDFSAVASKAI